MKIGIHMLTPYPPSNPNRDELGSPKTAVVGDVLRQRISSQAMKRAWRLSKIMDDLNASMSTRTRRVGAEAMKRMVDAGMDEKEAEKAARAILVEFGKEEKKTLRTSEVVIFGTEEWDAVMALADQCATEKRQPTAEETKALPRDTTSLDVAMFGRMRAAHPSLNIDAAVSVAHALTTGKTTIEADYWTAVDDLNTRDEDAGAGGIGEREFGSGLFYGFAIVDVDHLVENAGGDERKAKKAVEALIRAMATETPGGHRTSFAHHTLASYLRVEAGDQVVGNLMVPAFEEPVEGTSVAIERLREVANKYHTAYGLNPAVFEMSVPDGLGTLDSVIESTRTALGQAVA